MTVINDVDNGDDMWALFERALEFKDEEEKKYAQRGGDGDDTDSALSKSLVSDKNSENSDAIDVDHVRPLTTKGWRHADESIGYRGRCNGGATHMPSVPTCTFCQSNDIKLIDGNYECMDCHTIVTRLIDNSPEWRYLGTEDNRVTNPTRCGPPTNSLIPNLGSSMAASFSRVGGNCYGVSRALQKLHMWNSITHRDRNLYHIFEGISLASANHGISQCIIDEAKSLYKRVSDSKKITRGENRKAVIACSVYMACKFNGVPRSVKEIASIFQVDTSAMTKACKLYQELLQTNVASSRPIDFLPRFCSKLELGADVVALCDHVIKITEDLCIVTECTPPSLVASVIYMSCLELRVNVSKKKIAEECQLSQVTVSKGYKHLKDHRNILIPGDLENWTASRRFSNKPRSRI
jgi:transcription initiation factor TFIIB